MAELDVSDVLDDPDFQSSFSLIRSTAVVDNFGTNVVTKAAAVTALGVIQPAGAKDLDRMPDLARQGGAIQIWTRFALLLDVAPVYGSDGATLVTAGTEADEIVYGGSTYAVMSSDPWLYGSGYWRSLASLKSLS